MTHSYCSLQALADRAVALGPEEGRTKELMGWAVCEIERLRRQSAEFDEMHIDLIDKHVALEAENERLTQDLSEAIDHASKGWQLLSKERESGRKLQVQYDQLLSDYMLLKAAGCTVRDSKRGGREVVIESARS